MKRVAVRLLAALGWAASLAPLALAQQPPPQQAPSNWQTGVDARPQTEAPAGAGWSTTLPGTRPAAPVPPAPRAPAEPKASATQAPGISVSLVATITEESQAIDQGLVWRVYRDQKGLDEKSRLAGTFREASPALRLEPGDYIVHVGFGRAHLTRKIKVASGKAVTEKFVLNAGGLRLNAVLVSGEPAPERTVHYDIYSDDRDQFGQRTKVMSGAKPGLIIRLNAGLYHVVSTYGDANAHVRSDVAVEAGKLTELTASHAGAKVMFKLVTETGGNAIPDTQWSLANQLGEVIKESAGAVPTHILAAGTYSVTARHSGKSFKRDFSVQAGDVAQVEVRMN